MMYDLCQGAVFFQTSNPFDADTNADPEGVNYVIPGIDDAVKSIRFYFQDKILSRAK